MNATQRDVCILASMLSLGGHLLQRSTQLKL